MPHMPPSNMRNYGKLLLFIASNYALMTFRRRWGSLLPYISMKTRLSSISRERQNHNRNFYFNDWHFPHNSILHSLKSFLIFNLNQRFLSSSHLRSIWKISLPLPQSMMSTTLRVMQIRKLFHSFVLSSARSRRAISRELDNTDFKWWAKWRD